MKVREIKFRAWQDGEMIYHSGACDPYGLKQFFDKLYTDNHNVMQYIGIEDCNGTEIYEGDIYRRYNYIYLVKWDNEATGFVGDCIGRKKDFEEGYESPPNGSTQVYWMDEQCEVIGNIHEHSELIKNETA